MINTIDEAGMLNGNISEHVVNDFNRHKVVTQETPETALSGFQKWRWIAGTWQIAIDYRGHSWYNPDNTLQVHTPTDFDDGPPEGWLHWVPGQNQVVGNVEQLAKLKELKWTEIKAKRVGVIDAVLVTPYGVFDSDSQARTDIADSVLLAKTSADMGHAVVIDFTLADNTVVPLNLTAISNVGLMLGYKVQTARAIATELRQQIEAATTVEAVEAVQWPV